MEQIREIVFFGAGNVAVHLSKLLARKGYSIVQLVNRSPGPGRDLAHQLGADFVESASGVNPEADLYVLAVADAAIPEIISTLRVRKGMVLHTSGSVPLEILSPSSSETGVLYPLQTFRKGRRVTWNRVPVCVEANPPAALEKLRVLASRISSSVYVLDSRQRKVLHLTAVFAGNFTNYLYTVAEELLQQYDLPFELLKPLITQTAANVRHGRMFSQQTGPAAREERTVIEHHLEMLAGHPEYREIYELLSNQIMQHKYRHGKR